MIAPMGSKQKVSDDAAGALGRLKDVAGSAKRKAADAANVTLQRAVAAKDSLLDRLPTPAKDHSIDLSTLTPEAKLLYYQVLANTAAIDGVLDPGEAEHLELVASIVGLDDGFHPEWPEDPVSALETADLATTLRDCLDASERELVFTSLVRDLVQIARADGEVTDDEKQLIMSVADVVFPDSAQAVVGAAERLVDDEETAVRHDRDDIREFVATLDSHDILSGEWFTKLIAHAFRAYTEKVNWQYFQEKYKGVPADAIVDQRIKMATRYAEIAGGLSASAYTATVAATIGSLGAASPVAIPAAAVTLVVDLAYITQLQLHLAYDISALYRVPLDISDPEDLWKLIRVAFTIKSGEVAREGVVKAVPLVVRPLIKRVLSGSALQAMKTLPLVGKYLLQRTVIKVGIPAVGIPLAVLVNHYTTLVAGRYARAFFRNEARLIELAETLSERTKHPNLLLWVAWLVITADRKTSDDEAFLMRNLFRLVSQQHSFVDERLANVVQVDADHVWQLVASEPGDLSDVIDAAERIAAADGKPSARETAIISTLREQCGHC